MYQHSQLQWPYQPPQMEGSTCNSPLRHYQVGFSPATNLRPQQKKRERSITKKNLKALALVIIARYKAIAKLELYQTGT